MCRRIAMGLVASSLTVTVLVALSVAVPSLQATAVVVNHSVLRVAATPAGYGEASSDSGAGVEGVAGNASVPVPPSGPLRLALYGDSLVSEAGQDFAYLASNLGASVRVHTFPGTATCDFFSSMAADAQDWRPTAAVLAFSGDAFTPCMAGDQIGTPQYYAKYKDDTQAAISIFRSIGTQVVLVGLPLDASADLSQNASALNRIYQSLAATDTGVTYDDAGEAVLANGQFSWTLPCLSGEPCTGPAGTNVVRAPDGVHFCPDGKTTLVGGFEECDVYSSGAFRFASAMLASALAPRQLSQTGTSPLATCRADPVHVRRSAARKGPRATRKDCRSRPNPASQR